MPGLLGQLAAKFAGVPIIINTVHGFYFTNDTPTLRKRIFIFLEKISARCSTLIFSQNKEDIETAVKEKICSPEKVKYLGNGIDIDKFKIDRFSKGFIDKKKRELNIPADFKIIGINARLVKEKGYLDLFRAFKLILEVFPKTILLSIGSEEPEKNDAIKPKIAKDYEIEKNVVFLGERRDVDELYPLMDVFVLPSHREGFPRSILEAMAEKRPVVASDIRGCKEEIESGENGILVPLKNPEKLAEAIIYLFKNPVKVKELGEKARLKAVKEFDEKLIFDRIKKEYSLLLKNN